jgi:tetratricopeptide (TPR) repeat protein
MDPDFLQTLFNADEATLHTLISDQLVTEGTLEELKDLSAQFYFADPAKALQIATTASRLGGLLSIDATALGYWTLANAWLFNDRYHQAVRLFEQARAIYLAQGRWLDAARMGVGHVWSLAYTGQFDQALALATEIKPVLEQSATEDRADRSRLGGLYNNVGIIYDLMGHYEESLDAYDQKLKIALATGNALDVARTQLNRGCTLTYLNAFDEARTAFQQAQPALAQQQAHADLARLAFNQGTLYARWGKFPAAENAFIEAGAELAALEGVEQFQAVIRLYRGLARFAHPSVPIAQILEELNAARLLLSTHGPLFEEGLAWLGLGQCHLALKAFDFAQLDFEQVLALARAGAGRPLNYEALAGLAVLNESRGNATGAVEFYEQALSEIESIRGELRINTLRASFLADKLTIYQNLVIFYAKLAQPADSFATVERAKSRLLAEHLAGRLSGDVAALAQSADQLVRPLAHNLADTLKQLENSYRQIELAELMSPNELGLSTPDPTTALEVSQLEKSVVNLVRQIERLKPMFGALSTGYTIPLKDIQLHLQNKLLLQYQVVRDQIWVFAVNDTGLTIYQDIARVTEIETAWQRLLAAIDRILGLAARYGTVRLKLYWPALLADADTHLRDLYDLLIRPVASHLHQSSTVIISPDGPLHYIPFQALSDGKTYLIEQQTISYTPSATILDLCARYPAAGRGVLAVGWSGNRLQQINAEIQSVRELFPDATCLSEAEATTDQLLSKAPACQIIHLAAHAHFRTDSPLLSSLSFADRRLTLAEVSRLQLSADLVTLSGCETGRGRLQGADLISLASGFLGAGAKSLLVSLWQVDDSMTAGLMKDIYGALRAGIGKATALRSAQLKLLQQGRDHPAEYGFYCHPAYWASFVLIGESGEISWPDKGQAL